MYFIVYVYFVGVLKT